ALVLSARLGRRTARRALVRHAGVLPAPGRPGVRDLLEQWPRRGGVVTQLRAARHNRVRAAGGLGGLPARLAPAPQDQRGTAPHRWAPPRPMAAAGRRPLGQPALTVEEDAQGPLELRRLFRRRPEPV